VRLQNGVGQLPDQRQLDFKGSMDLICQNPKILLKPPTCT
jgi:hypothetical protein